MTIEEKIALVKRNTEEFISQIDKIGFNEDLGLVKFVLVSCLVDSVAAYGYQKQNNNEQYKNFIKKYLGQVNALYRNDQVANVLYHGIRCSLIHSFTISKNILLTEASDEKVHLSTNSNSHLIVDLVTFFNDLKKAIKLFFTDLNSGKGGLQKHFKKGFSKNPPFEIYKNVDLLDPNQPATGTTEIKTISYRKVNFRRSNYS
ncbi:MAG: hypothetical protein JNK50_00105 [Bacteroidia bacterium]|nr:hypothetical protein [Bacteroidia bacterium]